MDNLFLLLFLLSPVLFIIGLIKPSLFQNKFPRANLSRKRLSGIFLVLFIISIIGFDKTYVAPDKNETEMQVQENTTQENVSSLELTKDNVVVNRVIDGDTIETEGGNRVRYIGMDTPETSPIECFGDEAAKRNRELVEGKEVRLEKDVSETDRYNRLLRYIWVGDKLINELLVREGFATSVSYPPDVKYQERFREAERLAREEKSGLWGDVCISPTATSTVAVTSAPQVKSSNTQSTTAPTKTPTPIKLPTKIPTPYFVQPTTTIYKAPTNTPQPTTPPASGGSGSWVCDCSLTCARDITSCEQAQWLLNFCKCSARDRDKDGIACDDTPLYCQN